jgi:DNA replication protein DnaC
MSRIKETLSQITNGMSKENMATSANGDRPDPNCPICHGLGYLSRDVPIDDPDFGKMHPCECRQDAILRGRLAHLFDASNLGSFAGMTFDSFNPDGRPGTGVEQQASLAEAMQIGQTYAETLDGWLVFQGTYGCGKTHLAAAVANQVIRRGIATLFLTVPDLLDWLRYAYGDPTTSFEDRFEEIRNIAILVLDDLGTQNATPWAQEKLFQIVDYRYLRRLPTIVTTNLDLDQLDPRIRSRLLDSAVVRMAAIKAPDYRSEKTELSDPLLISLSLLADRTLGNFSLREPENLPAQEQRSLEKGFRAAQAYAENPSGWLVLMGGYGSGKTHLAAGIANYRHMMGEEPIFVAVPDLLDHLRAAFSPTSTISFDDRFERVKTCPLLILDDLGTQSATPWAREKLYQIFNYRSMARLPMVITTASTLDELDGRIRSRMLDERMCKIHILLVPPYRASAAPQPAPRKPRK